MNSQNIKDVEKKGIGFISGVAIKPGTQVFPLTSRDVFYSENIVLTHTDRFVLSQYGAMRIWLTCIGANYTGADALTVRFYRAEGDVGATRMAIVKDVAVTLPNVNNGYSGYVNVPDTTGILADCTHFSINGTITRPAGATIKAVVTAYASDSTEVEIINSGAIATKDENSDDILAELESIDTKLDDNATKDENSDDILAELESIDTKLDDLADVKTAVEKLDTGDQKTQIVDGDGNVIGSTDNRLNVNTVESDNFESSIVGVETWLELPENIKAVSFILDCSDNTEATLEYTFDRSASPAVAIESELGTLVNDKEGGYLAGAVAQVRMNDVVTNAVVEVKSSLSTDLVGNNNDLVYTSKLNGIGGDDITIMYDDNTPTSVAEVKSTLSTDLVGDNNDLVYTSKLNGTEGDDITIAYIDPSDINQALSIVVTGTDIAVNLATDADGIITTTADDISAAIALDVDANALVGVADKAGNDGSGLVTAMVATALSGGVDAVNTVTTVTVTDTDIVVGLAKDTSNVITSTATQVKTTIEATPTAHALVGVANKAGNDGSGVVTEMDEAALTGGVNAVAATLPKLWIIGVK